MACESDASFLVSVGNTALGSNGSVPGIWLIRMKTLAVVVLAAEDIRLSLLRRRDGDG